MRNGKSWEEKDSDCKGEKREFSNIQVGEKRLRKLGMFPWRREGLDTSEPSGVWRGCRETGETGKVGMAPQL